MTGVTPHGIRYPDGASKAKNLGPELQQMAEDIDGFIDDQLDPNGPLKTIIEDVAEVVVPPLVPPIVNDLIDARVAGLPDELDLMTAVSETDVPRTSRATLPVTFRDKKRSVFYPKVYPRFYPAATWSGFARRSADVPTLREDGTLAPDVIPEIAPGVLTGLQVQAVDGGPLVFEVRPDGQTYVQGVPVTPGGGSGGTTVKRVVALPGLGQSNLVAHGQPTVSLLDGTSDQIWQIPDGGDILVPAVVPLSMPGGTATGLSPVHVLAREIALRDPECVVVIVPAAKGGSGLVTDPSIGYGSWSIDYAGPNPRLYSNALAKMTTALSQIAARWPGITPSVVTAWIQGEADGSANITGAAYQAALDALIADWVSRYGGTFLIAGIVPQAATSGTRPAIVNVLEDTPRRVERTAFVPGVNNGGGARGPSDEIHYGREAIEIIGRAWYEAIPRASNNVAGSYTSPPVHVTATRWGTEVRAEWSAPYCRVTEYQVQSSTDGTTWEDVTIVEPVATSVTFTSSAPVKVRVRAIGTETSNWTAPEIAIGG